MTAGVVKTAAATLLCAAIFCGCYDSMELNERAYVNAMSIDKGESGRFMAGVAISDISEHGSSDSAGESEGKSKNFKKSPGKTLSASIQSTNANSSQSLFFGQTRAVFFGEGLLKDKKLFMEAIDGLERNKELSRKTLVLAVNKNAADVCGAAPNGEPSIGVFAEKFYNKGVNSDKTAASLKMNLEDMMIKLRSNSNAVIPKITEKDGEIQIGGAAVLGGLSLCGYLDEEETRGYIWQFGEISGTDVELIYKGVPVPYKVLSHNADISFYETEKGLSMNVTIKTTGTVTEYVFGSGLNNEKTLMEIENLAAEQIKKEAISVNNKLQQQFKCDGADILSVLRKKDYGLWRKYESRWQSTFEEMRINVIAKAKIKSIGSIK